MESKKDNIILQYLKHPSMWIRAMLGKPMPIQIPEHQVTYQTQQNQSVNMQTQEGQQHIQASPTAQQQPSQTASPQPQSKESDSVLGDVMKVKGILSKLTGRVKTAAAPMVEKGLTQTSHVAASGSAFAKTDKFKKMVPMLLFILVLFVIILVAFFALKKLNLNFGKNNTPEIVSEPSPTPVEYKPSEPSVYSDDPEVLRLEEIINQLDREIAGTQLREPTLNAPTLDFDINFNAK